MTYLKRICLFLTAALLSSYEVAQQKSNASIPFLQKQGTATQLMVEGKPFLVLGGELGNSSASDMAYMQPIWSKVKDMHLNTLLVPVYWELLEPQEGKFNFSLVDDLIKEARQHHLKLVLLWFGSWKNSMSSYAPVWVKTDLKRFPRAQDKKGKGQEILSPFHQNNLAAETKAFTALMKHLKETDAQLQTVIMIQVENEIGMLPEARDHSPAANAAFQQQVPKVLLNYLQKNKGNLGAGVEAAWKSSGYKTSGTWEEVFGKSLATDEIFIAWHFAQYANSITEAGKKIYPLPMFTNAALNRPNVKPGDYPSGGPLPHIIDIWKAGAPALDFLSPDFYNPDFKYWNDLYTRKDNPLFIPEIRFEPSVDAKAFYTFGHYQAIGFSPFSIESTDKPKQESLGKAYEVLSQLSPVILAHQGKGTMEGVMFDKANPTTEVKLGDYTLTFKHDYTLGWSPQAKEETWPATGGLIIQTGEDEFILAGTGMVVSFASNDKNLLIAGIALIDEGTYENGVWKPGRRMNGDQSHQGRHLRFEVGNYGIQKLKLYKYK